MPTVKDEPIQFDEEDDLYGQGCEINKLLKSLEVPLMFRRETVMQNWKPFAQKRTFDNAVFI